MKPLPLLLCALAALGNTVADEPAKQPGEPKDAFHYNRQLGRGINFGNALEAPRESEWGVTLREDYFERAQRAGFRSVRIPIRWSAHAGGAAPAVQESRGLGEEEQSAAVPERVRRLLGGGHGVAGALDAGRRQGDGEPGHELGVLGVRGRLRRLRPRRQSVAPAAAERA